MLDAPPVLGMHGSQVPPRSRARLYKKPELPPFIALDTTEKDPAEPRLGKDDIDAT